MSQNAQVDALARLASTINAKLLEVIPIEFFSTPSIQPVDPPQTVNCVTTVDN